MSLDLNPLIESALSMISAATSPTELDAVRVEFMGKKGKLTAQLKAIGSLPVSEKPAAGAMINEAKKRLQGAMDARKDELDNAALDAQLAGDTIDITLPGRHVTDSGLHPITLTIRRISELFSQLGFTVAEGPEIENDYYNFEALNFPPHHPARAMHDTFYVEGGDLLRTHTSSVQIRHMQANKPPHRIIAPGRVYRCDSDQTHTPMFHQVEGLLVDKHITFADLMGDLEGFLKMFFDQDDCEIRFRPSYFPFTEPSTEVDIRIGGGRWLEVLGAGMVHPEVFKAVNIDTEQFTGYAFGMGVERLASLRYGVADIRQFFENDIRFLRQFNVAGGGR